MIWMCWNIEREDMTILKVYSNFISFTHKYLCRDYKYVLLSYFLFISIFFFSSNSISGIINPKQIFVILKKTFEEYSTIVRIHMYIPELNINSFICIYIGKISYLIKFYQSGLHRDSACFLSYLLTNLPNSNHKYVYILCIVSHRSIWNIKNLKIIFLNKQFILNLTLHSISLPLYLSLSHFLHFIIYLFFNFWE